jgi:hypothetical protein
MAFIATSHISFDEHLHSSTPFAACIWVDRRRTALHSHSIEERTADMFNKNIPALSQNFLRLIDMRVVAVRLTVLSALLLAVSSAASLAQSTSGGAPVGIQQLEYIDPHEGGRHLALAVFYPAAIRDRAAPPFVMPFFANLNKDAEPAFNGTKRPLIMFSHGRGSNGLYYAWFAEALASRGYIVAALNHYRANTYDSNIAYLANKLWQRPRDISLTISFLLDDPPGARRSTRIGSASPAIHRVGSPRCGWEARGSIRKSTSPSNAAGATIRWCRNICATSCRSMPPQRSTCTTNA